MADSPYKTIVVGSDGSKSSLLAVERAAKLAAAFGSTLVIGTAYYENEDEAAKALRQDSVTILGDEQAILPVAPVLQGEHGISDAALSVPCIVGAEGARPIPETPFSEDELSRLQASADALKKVAADLRG